MTVTLEYDASKSTNFRLLTSAEIADLVANGLSSKKLSTSPSALLSAPSSESALARTACRPEAAVSPSAAVPIAVAIAALSAKPSPAPPVPK